jgi:hypothetical protein
MLVQDQSAHRPVSTLIWNCPPKQSRFAQVSSWREPDGQRGTSPKHAKSHLPVRANELLAGINRGGIVGAIRFMDFAQAVLSDHVDAIVRHNPPRPRQSWASSLQGKKPVTPDLAVNHGIRARGLAARRRVREGCGPGAPQHRPIGIADRPLSRRGAQRPDDRSLHWRTSSALPPAALDTLYPPRCFPPIRVPRAYTTRGAGNWFLETRPKVRIWKMFR